MTLQQTPSFACNTAHLQKKESIAYIISFLFGLFLWLFGLISLSNLNLNRINGLIIVIFFVVFSCICVLAYIPMLNFLLKVFKIQPLSLSFSENEISVKAAEASDYKEAFTEINLPYSTITQINIVFYAHIAVDRKVEISLISSAEKYDLLCFIHSDEELSLFVSVLKFLYEKQLNINEKDANDNTLFLLQKTSSGDEIEAYYTTLIHQIGKKEENKK